MVATSGEGLLSMMTRTCLTLPWSSVAEVQRPPGVALGSGVLPGRIDAHQLVAVLADVARTVQLRAQGVPGAVPRSLRVGRRSRRRGHAQQHRRGRAELEAVGGNAVHGCGPSGNPEAYE